MAEERMKMREALMAVLIMMLNMGGAFAQTTSPNSEPHNNPAANAPASKQAPAPAQSQPQGPTGPTDTKSGGVPASSPQGDSPPGMQPDPHNPKQDIAPKK